MRPLFRYALGLCLLLSACHTDDSVEASLPAEAGGFSGTLPGGLSLNPASVVSTNGVVTSANSVDGSFVSHLLDVRDTTTNISISLELPYVQYSEAFIRADSADVARAVAEYYSYEVVKDKLSVGEKQILAPPAHDITSSFAVHVTDSRRYFSFITFGVEQPDSYLRVRELTEGVETDSTGAEVRTLEVVIDLSVKVSREADASQPERLEGTLRMKYRERG